MNSMNYSLKFLAKDNFFLYFANNMICVTKMNVLQ